MTQAKLSERVKLWQQRLSVLGIAHWRFTLEFEEEIDASTGDGDPDMRVTARVDADRYYDTATFVFEKEAVAKKPDRELDELIVHEWLHVADRDRDAVESALLDYLSPDARDAEGDRLTAAREGEIERLARLIVTLAA